MTRSHAGEADGEADDAADGGVLMARALARQGVRHAFCVPGESYLPLLAALPDAGIRVITCRHEGAAAMAAEAMGRLGGGVPGLCLVTRAPGAANAQAGAVVARLDATPLVIIAGQVARARRHDDAFQDADLTAMFRPLCKHVEEICDPAALAGAVRRACRIARGGTPGPVFLSVPEDVLSAAVAVKEATGGADVAEAAAADMVPDASLPMPCPAAETVRRVAELLAGSERPLLIAGGGPHLWSARARLLLHELAARLQVPLVTAFRRQGLVDAWHEACAGTLGFRPDPALAEALRQADLLLLLGTRPSAVTLDNLRAAFDGRLPPMPVVHAHPDATVCGRALRADVMACTMPEAFLQALPVEDMLTCSAERLTARRRWREALHAAYLAWSDAPPPMPGMLDMGQVWLWLRHRLPPETIIASGAGNYALWLHRFFQHRDAFGQLAPVAGSMGYGLPAALAAKLRFPQRPVLAVAGDGCFQMSMQELATAAQYGLGIMVLVVDNGQLGTIRGHQLRRYPQHDCATALDNPDLAALARACGGFGAHVWRTEEFADRFRQAQEAAEQGQVALLHLHTAPEAIAPGVNAPADDERRS